MDNDFKVSEEEKLRRKKYNNEVDKSKRYIRNMTIGMILVFVIDIVLDNVFFSFNYGLLSFIGFNNWLWGILYVVKGEKGEYESKI